MSATERQHPGTHDQLPGNKVPGSKLPGSKLPERPSELLALAVADARKMPDDDRYEPDAGVFHSAQQEGGPCHACLAGAVMAYSLDAGPRERLCPTDFDDATTGKLKALNEMRESEWSPALQLLGIPPQQANEMESLLLEKVRIKMVDFEGERQFKIFLDSIEPAVSLLRDAGL